MADQSTNGTRQSWIAAAIAGVAANVILGISSLYWRALGDISPGTLLACRVILSLLTLIVLMALLGRLSGIRSRLSLRAVAIHAAAALLVVANWGTFIWASIHGHVVESGLGYLIAPFAAIFIGVTVFKDRLGITRKLALTVIAACVGMLLWGSGELTHWVYLVIGVAWGGYACLKKITPLDAFSGLFTETAVLAVCLLLMLVIPAGMHFPPGLPPLLWALLALCGLVSVIPLWLFSQAAISLPLSVMGFFQFVLPITQLLVAVSVYRQAMSFNTVLCFGAISLALLMIVAEPLLARWFRAGFPGAANETL